MNVRIINVWGQTVIAEVSTSGKIDISAFPAGVYRILIDSGEKKASVAFIKY
jgi:hypothetical protein